jgi:hypothetical protein
VELFVDTSVAVVVPSAGRADFMFEEETGA